MDPRQLILNQVKESVGFIENQTDIKPKIGIILGSGLSGLGDTLELRTSLPYSKIPYFPIPTTKGHKGDLVIGRLGDKDLAIMEGRFHYYEGYTMAGIALPVRVLAKLGIQTLIVTGAAGAVNPNFEVGDIMVVEDHLSLMPSNPLIGPYVEELGERFPDMGGIYDEQLIAIAKKSGLALNLKLKQGVYAAVCGPSYETAAEMKFLKTIGADCVGMSIVPEVIVSSQLNLKVLGMTIVSNKFQAHQKVTHEQVLDNVAKIAHNFSKLILEILNYL